MRLLHNKGEAPMYTMFSDTIAAISTPHGKGGVAVIRISGENAFEIAEKFIFPKSKKSFAVYRNNLRRYMLRMGRLAAAHGSE